MAPPGHPKDVGCMADKPEYKKWITWMTGNALLVRGKKD